MVDSVSDDDTDEDADNAGNYRENRMLVPRSFCYDALSVTSKMKPSLIDLPSYMRVSRPLEPVALFQLGLNLNASSLLENSDSST